MGKRQKTLSVWGVLLRGLGMALLLYAGGTAAMALLVVKGYLRESLTFPAMAVLCAAAGFVGSSLTSGCLPWGRMLNAMLTAAVFAAVLVGIGASCCGGILWSGHGGMLLLCALGGGMLAGVLGDGRRKGKRKRKKGRL